MIQIKGAEEFQLLARRLHAAGDGQIVRGMARDMRLAARPLVSQAQANVRGLAVAGVRGSGKHSRAAFDVSKARKVTTVTRDRAAGRSGLRATTARATVAQVSTSARTARVRVRVNTARLPHDQRQLPMHMNRGKWRHPVFGNREIWVPQTAPPAWFDDAMRSHGPQVRDAARIVIDKIERDLAA